MSLTRVALRALQRAEELCIAGCILGIAGVTIANVLARSLGGASVLFAEEASRFMVVIVTFAGIGHAARRGRHVRMTAFVDALPPRLERWFSAFIALGTSLLLAYLSVLGVGYVLDTVRALGSVSPVLQVPRYVVYAVAPAGLALGAVQYAVSFVSIVLHGHGLDAAGAGGGTDQPSSSVL